MYAIPAETASQNMPFKKEDLPGPGKLILPGKTICLCRRFLDEAMLLQNFWA